MTNLFTDLEHIEFKYAATHLQSIPIVSIYAIGGFPIEIINDIPHLLGVPINKDFLSLQIKKSLGLSGMLTYLNKSNFSLEEMGDKCKELNHFWGYNFITISFLFSGVNPKVELSFLRNNTFYESWIIGSNKLFGMTGTIKDFKKFISNKDDKSFDIETREIMTLIDNNYNFLWK